MQLIPTKFNFSDLIFAIRKNLIPQIFHFQQYCKSPFIITSVFEECSLEPERILALQHVVVQLPESLLIIALAYTTYASSLKAAQTWSCSKSSDSLAF